MLTVPARCPPPHHQKGEGRAILREGGEETPRRRGIGGCWWTDLGPNGTFGVGDPRLLLDHQHWPQGQDIQPILRSGNLCLGCSLWAAWAKEARLVLLAWPFWRVLRLPTSEDVRKGRKRVPPIWSLLKGLWTPGYRCTRSVHSGRGSSRGQVLVQPFSFVNLGKSLDLLEPSFPPPPKWTE